MAVKKKGAHTANYGEMHKNLKNMTEKELRAAMQQEVERAEPRHDMLRRLLGRFNKIRGRSAVDSVFALLKVKGKRDVEAALSSDR